jgi:hypothetical protein
MTAVLHWLKQVGVALDQFLNALAGGWADETFSARCWRHQRLPGWNLARRVVDGLLFFDKGHCEASYRSEALRLQSPPATRLRTCSEHDTPLQE